MSAISSPESLIIHRNKDFIVVNKPAGIPVHKQESTAGVLEHLPEGEDYFLCHRLDKETSGLLLIALNKEAAAELSGLFAVGKVSKYYLAVTDKRPSKSQGTVSGDMVKARNGSWKLTRAKTKPAITAFFSRSLKPGFRSIILRPLTGKTHQIRVMMASLSAPVLGDTRYKGGVADRMYLHAYQLGFSYQGQEFSFRQLPAAGSHFESVIPSDDDPWLNPQLLPWPGKTART